MKTSLLLLATLLAAVTTNAQYTQDFESGESNLSGNCWSMDQGDITGDPGDVITGNASLFTNPPTNGAGRKISSPVLNVVSTSFQVSFNYKLSELLNGNATRSIEVGVEHASGGYTQLTTIVMDRFTPAGVHNYNNTFTLSSTGNKKLIVTFSGSNGLGSVRIIFDDLFVNASPRYGAGTCNTAPVAVNDVFTTIIGGITVGNVMTNDIEPDGENMTAATVTISPNGVLVMGSNGGFIFTPFILFTGPSTSFTYRLTDNGFSPLQSNTATVTVNYVTNATLPVNLVSFNAMLVNNKVNLSWTTASENNVSHFVVEKSTDGNSYSDAGIVFATGNSTEKMNYAFTDMIGTTEDKVIYYRLRSVDMDGKMQQSDTRIIRLTKSAGPSVSIIAYPNPVTTDLRITIPASWQNKKVTYEVYSLNGTLAAKSVNSNSSQTETINIAKAAAGVYMVRVSCGTEIAQQKIIKQ